jgi:hypothetical protein
MPNKKSKKIISFNPRKQAEWNVIKLSIAIQKLVQTSQSRSTLSLSELTEWLGDYQNKLGGLSILLDINPTKANKILAELPSDIPAKFIERCDPAVYSYRELLTSLVCLERKILSDLQKVKALKVAGSCSQLINRYLLKSLEQTIDNLYKPYQQSLLQHAAQFTQTISYLQQLWFTEELRLIPLKQLAETLFRQWLNLEEEIVLVSFLISKRGYDENFKEQLLEFLRANNLRPLQELWTYFNCATQPDELIIKEILQSCMDALKISLIVACSNINARYRLWSIASKVIAKDKSPLTADYDLWQSRTFNNLL